MKLTKKSPGLQPRALIRNIIQIDHNTIRNSRKKAIERHCKSCIYDEMFAGTWREQTGDCASFRCALWHYRPTPARTIGSDRIALRIPGMAENRGKSE